MQDLALHFLTDAPGPPHRRGAVEERCGRDATLLALVEHGRSAALRQFCRPVEQGNLVCVRDSALRTDTDRHLLACPASGARGGRTQPPSLARHQRRVGGVVAGPGRFRTVRRLGSAGILRPKGGRHQTVANPRAGGQSRHCRLVHRDAGHYRWLGVDVVAARAFAAISKGS